MRFPSRRPSIAVLELFASGNQGTPPIVRAGPLREMPLAYGPPCPGARFCLHRFNRKDCLFCRYHFLPMELRKFTCHSGHRALFMNNNHSTLFMIVMLVIGGSVFQWLACVFVIWIFFGTNTIGVPTDLQVFCVMASNLPVGLVLCSEWWRQRLGRALVLSAALNLIFAAFCFLLVLSAGC